MSNRINPDDFINDPMFKELRAFGSNTSDLNKEIPTEVLMAYRNASAVKTRKVWLRRSIFSILAIGILAPSLSYAQLLPTPVDNVVKRVTHLVTAPIRIVSETVSKVTNSNPPEQNLNDAPDTATATPSPSPTQSSTSVSVPAPVAPQVQAVPTPTRKPEQHEQEKSQAPRPAKSVKPVEQKSEKSDDGESKSSPSPSVSPTSKKESGEGESEKSGASAKPLPAASSAAPKPTVAGGGESKGETKKLESKKED